MSFKFQLNILLVLCMFLSPITLQAYCNLEGCSGYDQANEDQERPLTMQEARKLNDFYTSIDRDLSENLEVLPDGTHQVAFSEDVNILYGMIAVPYGHGDYLDDDVKFTKEDARLHSERWHRREDRFEGGNQALRRYFKDKPKARIKETLELFEHTLIIDINDPKLNYGVGIIRERIDIDRGGERNTVVFYRKVSGHWIRSNTQWTFEIGPEGGTFKRGGYLNTLITSLQHKDPQVFENYLKKRKIGFTGPIIWNKIVRTTRSIGRGIKVAGRWAFRGILAGAGILGTQMLWSYAQEKNPHETGLVIAITKQQYERLAVSVRAVIQEIAEHPVLDELELPSQQAVQSGGL